MEWKVVAYSVSFLLSLFLANCWWDEEVPLPLSSCWSKGSLLDASPPDLELLQSDGTVPFFFFRCTGPTALLRNLSWPEADMLHEAFHGFSCASHVVSQVATQTHNLILSYSWLSLFFCSRTMLETCCFRHEYFSYAMKATTFRKLMLL